MLSSSSSSFDVRFGGGPEEVGVIVPGDVAGVDGDGEADRGLGLDDGLLSDVETVLDLDACGADGWVGLVSSSSSS
jgi:hypothetical protein